MTTGLIDFVFDDGEEGLVEYKVTSWGRGPTMASWNYPGDPGDPVEFDLVAAFGADGVTKRQMSEAECERAEKYINDNPPHPDDGYDYD